MRASGPIDHSTLPPAPVAPATEDFLPGTLMIVLLPISFGHRFMLTTRVKCVTGMPENNGRFFNTKAFPGKRGS